MYKKVIKKVDPRSIPVRNVYFNQQVFLMKIFYACLYFLLQ